MWRYRNPVEVQFGAGVFDRLGDALGGRAYCLVTYDDANGGGFFAELARRVAALAGRPASLVRNIGPNPDYDGLTESCRLYAQATRPIEAIVALGGGSVIDAAKVLAAASDGAGSDFSKVRTYLETGTGADTLGATPIIAIPTTAGTGSEVTRNSVLGSPTSPAARVTATPTSARSCDRCSNETPRRRSSRCAAVRWGESSWSSRRRPDSGGTSCASAPRHASNACSSGRRSSACARSPGSPAVSFHRGSSKARAAAATPCCAC